MKKKINLKDKKIIAVIAIFCAFLWGAATPAIKIGYELYAIPSTDTVDIILFAGYRFYFAGILALLLGSIMEKHILIPKKTSWGIVTFQAMIQTVFQYVFFFIGLANTVGAKGPIISGTASFFSVIIAGLFFRIEKVTPKAIIGCIIGFVGIVILNISDDFKLSFKLLGEGALVFSTIMYALSSVTLKIFNKKDDSVTICAWQFILGGAILIISAKILGGHLNPTVNYAWITIAALSFISAGAYTLWCLLLKFNDVSKITVYSLAIPVFGVVLSMILLSEKINPVQYFIALALVCLGIFVVNEDKRRKMIKE